MKRSILVVALVLPVALSAQSVKKAPLTAKDVDAIATLLMLEDARKFDEAELKKLAASAHPEVRRRAVQAVGRIADKAGGAIVEAARQDKDAEVAATAVWSMGQLRDAAAVPTLAALLTNPKTPAPIAREAAIALGKIQPPPQPPGPPPSTDPAPARVALADFLLKTPTLKPSAHVAGEALLSIGRFPARGDIAPIVRWTTAPDVEIRWRAAWALFRSRDPGAMKDLLRLSADPSAEVRYWAVRGLIPHENTDPAPAAARLREAASDSDRRVRTEAIRTLGQHKDEASVKLLLEALTDKDSWISVSAAEGLGQQPDRAELVAPRLADAAATTRPLALRITARQALGRLGGPGQAALEMAPTEGLPQPAGRGRGGARPTPQLLSLEEYKKIVEKWVVPDYNGAPKPRAVWDTPRGSIELELYPGESPLGVEFFMRVHDSKEIIGTQFTRVVPNFVAQQQAIRTDVVLRDEVSRRGLTRGNLSWASAGLDTGRPGYTLGVTPQPHNEGNFTALGRIVSGMDVLERIELNDAITAARIVRNP